jgi:hypothetical protein
VTFTLQKAPSIPEPESYPHCKRCALPWAIHG